MSAPMYFGRASARVLSTSLGNARGAFTLLNPLPPFGRCYVVEPWPFSISDQGVTALRSFSLAHERRPAPIDTHLVWADVHSVKAVARDVVINDAPFARCASRAHAIEAARAIERVKAGCSVDDVIADHLDPDRVRAKARRHTLLGLLPMIGATGLFFSLFVVVPVFVMREGVFRWPYLLALVFSWTLATMAASYRAHRALWPSATAERLQLVLLMLPAPTTALRVNDKLGRFLLAGSHPIAAALALLKGDHRDDVVRRALRDLEHPRPLPEANAISRHIEAAFRQCMLKQAAKLARDHGVKWDDDVEEGACPRCLTKYRDATACADCGIPLSRTPQT